MLQAAHEHPLLRSALIYSGMTRGRGASKPLGDQCLSHPLFRNTTTTQAPFHPAKVQNFGFLFFSAPVNDLLISMITKSLHDQRGSFSAYVRAYSNRPQPTMYVAQISWASLSHQCFFSHQIRFLERSQNHYSQNFG